jgi:hypothetical protein
MWGIEVGMLAETFVFSRMGEAGRRRHYQKLSFASPCLHENYAPPPLYRNTTEYHLIGLE